VLLPLLCLADLSNGDVITGGRCDCLDMGESLEERTICAAVWENML
jgi:hypothetical protein